MSDDRMKRMLEGLFADVAAPAEPEPRPEDTPVPAEIGAYQALIDNMQDGAFIIQDGVFQFVNPALLDMLGYEAREMVGADFASVVAPQDREMVVDRYRRRLAGEEIPNEYEIRLLRQDGTGQVHANMIVTIAEYQGKPATIGTVRDITGRSTMEQQVQASLARRTQEVQISTEVAQEMAGATALDELYRRVVTLVKERFGYYHTQIFRHDPEQNVMTLVEGYGQAGQTMAVAGHNLPYGRGVVGTAAAGGEPVLASDAAQDPNWVPHPTLPDTKGELAVPIKLKGKVLGILDVQSDRAGALTEEDQVLLLGLAGQIATAIESTRLAEESQKALAQTEALYAGSERVVRSTTDDQVLQALVESTALRRLDRASIIYFDHPWADDKPETATIVAAWERDGQDPAMPVGTRYPLDQFPALDAVASGQAVVLSDIATDSRVDDSFRAFLVEQLGMRSAGFWPLVAGGQWIGIIAGQARTIIDITDSEMRQIASLVDQAASVIRTFRQVEQIEARARREQVLREITARVRSYTDPDTLARTAVRELGLALGRPTFIRLGSAEELAQPPASQQDGDDGE